MPTASPGSGRKPAQCKKPPSTRKKKRQVEEGGRDQSSASELARPVPSHRCPPSLAPRGGTGTPRRCSVRLRARVRSGSDIRPTSTASWSRESRQQRRRRLALQSSLRAAGQPAGPSSARAGGVPASPQRHPRRVGAEPTLASGREPLASPSSAGRGGPEGRLRGLSLTWSSPELGPAAAAGPGSHDLSAPSSSSGGANPTPGLARRLLPPPAAV